MAYFRDMIPLNATVQHGYPVARWRVSVLDHCIKCGLCVDECPTGVFRYPDALNALPQPNSHRCIGPNCEANGTRTTHHAPPCVRICPVDAITIERNPSYESLGDKRWTSDLLTATWYEAQNARVPADGLEYRVGNSGGGFDAMRFVFEDERRTTNDE